MKIQLDFFVLIYEGALKLLSFTYLWTYQYFNLKNQHLCIVAIRNNFLDCLCVIDVINGQ